MANIKINNVSIKGLAACVPSTIIENEVIYQNWGGYNNFLITTGIERHRNSTKDICASDLCYVAAEKLITELAWNKNEIEALIFVSQTPDFYCVPATSNYLQERLDCQHLA